MTKYLYIPLLTLGFAGVLAVNLSASAVTSSVTRVSCGEIIQELKDAVKDGIFTQEEANYLANRCSSFHRD